MYFDWEASFLLWIQENLRCDALDFFFSRFTRLMDYGIIAIVAAILLFVYPKTRKAGIAVGAALVINALLCNVMIKPLIARTRPYDLIEGLRILIPRQVDTSFPSGHTSASVAAAVAIFMTCDRKIGIPALVIAFLIAWSRLYVGVHFPTDVLGGILLGALSGVIAVAVTKIINSSIEEKRHRS